MNLETGKKEAKILQEENEEKTSLVATETNDEKSDVDIEIEPARKRLEEALKNIPSDKFDVETEEKSKEISHKFRSYKEIKDELKDSQIVVKTEMEIMNSLVNEVSVENLNPEARHQILEELEYLCHSIDNSLHFISIGGLEKIVVPSLNDSNSEIGLISMRLLGVVLQNNDGAKNHVIEKTNIANYLINILSKSTDADQQSIAIFAFGSLVRNNQKVIEGLNSQSPSETFKKGISVVSEIISNQKTTLKVSLKALTLIGDLLSDIPMEHHENISKYVEMLKVCGYIMSFFNINRNTLISDIDSASLVIGAFNDLKTMCGGKDKAWSNSPKYRHDLLVSLNNFKSQLAASDEDSKFIFEEIVEKLESLTKFLFGHLEISDDDLSAKYKINDEL